MADFDLKVGFSCNNNCIHCVVADKRKTRDLNTQEIKSFIEKRQKGERIIFTGGEPTIRGDFIELIKHAKNRGHLVLLQTNGTRFSDYNFAQKTGKYIDKTVIAIHSYRKEVHNKIVQRSGMYEKTIKGFKNIVKLKILHDTQTVISKLNIDHLKETYDFIQAISPGCRMYMTFPHPMGNAYYNKAKVVPRYSEIKKYIFKALKKYSDIITTEAIPICYLFPYHNKVNNVDEEMLNHLRKKEIKAGADFSIKNGFIKDYFMLMLSDKKKGPECNRCVFNNRCAGTWKEYIEFYKNKLDLFPVNKKIINV